MLNYCSLNSGEKQYIIIHMYLLQALAGVEVKIATAIVATNSTVFILDQKMRKVGKNFGFDSSYFSADLWYWNSIFSWFLVTCTFWSAVAYKYFWNSSSTTLCAVWSAMAVGCVAAQNRARQEEPSLIGTKTVTEPYFLRLKVVRKW